MMENKMRGMMGVRWWSEAYSLELSKWQSCLLLLLFFLFACDQAREIEELIASAEKSEKEGQIKVAADLYHVVAELRPQDFNVQYRVALLYWHRSRNDGEIS